MPDLDDVDAILDEARVAMRDGKDIYADKELKWRLHDLAEAQNEKAKAFFVTMLDSEDSTWRLEGIRNVGFHYALRSDPDIVAKLRSLVLSDPDDHVRMTTASVLGIRSSWPDKALYQALETDEDRYVRGAAFQSLIDLLGLPHDERRELEKRMKGVERSGAGLAQVLGEEKVAELYADDA